MPNLAPQLAEVAHLIGDPARARMLSLMMDGREKTASELAAIAGITPQTTSSHLSQMVHRALLSVQKQGRKRLYRLSSPLVAHMLEAIMIVAATGPQRSRPPSQADRDNRRAQICYDHITGYLGVAIAEGLAERRHLIIGHDCGELTLSGLKLFEGLGIEFGPAGHPTYCKLCFDWSEQRMHIGGRVGAAISQLAFRMRWIQRQPQCRSVSISADGQAAFQELFGVTL